MLLQSTSFAKPVLSIAMKVWIAASVTLELACANSPPFMLHIRFRVTNRYGQCVPGNWIIALFFVHDLPLLLINSRYRPMHHKEQHQRLPTPNTQGNHL